MPQDAMDPSVTYQEMEAMIEAQVFDPVPFPLEPEWLDLPSITPSWLDLPDLEPEWLDLPAIEPEWIMDQDLPFLEPEHDQTLDFGFELES